MKDLIWFDFGSSYFQIPMALTRTAQRDSNVWKAHGPHSPPDISTNHCHPCQNGPLYQPHKQVGPSRKPYTSGPIYSSGLSSMYLFVIPPPNQAQFRPSTSNISPIERLRADHDPLFSAIGYATYLHGHLSSTIPSPQPSDRCKINGRYFTARS